VTQAWACKITLAVCQNIVQFWFTLAKRGALISMPVPGVLMRRLYPQTGQTNTLVKAIHLQLADEFWKLTDFRLGRTVRPPDLVR
jgi:hypothetical protein